MNELIFPLRQWMPCMWHFRWFTKSHTFEKNTIICIWHSLLNYIELNCKYLMTEPPHERTPLVCYCFASSEWQQKLTLQSSISLLLCAQCSYCGKEYWGRRTAHSFLSVSKSLRETYCLRACSGNRSRKSISPSAPLLIHSNSLFVYWFDLCCFNVRAPHMRAYLPSSKWHNNNKNTRYSSVCEEPTLYVY